MKAFCVGGPWDGRIVDLAPKCREFLVPASPRFVRYRPAPKRLGVLVGEKAVRAWIPAEEYAPRIEDRVRIVATGDRGFVQYLRGRLVGVRVKPAEGWPFPKIVEVLPSALEIAR